jgi:hypothetical protein
MLSYRGISLKVSGAVASALLVICIAGSAGALAAPTVTVRIEGESGTLLPATTVALGSPEPVSGCPANSVAAAINLAVGGNWDHGEASGSGGDFTETLLGETHAFTHEGDTWAEWVDYRWGGGICTDLLSEGDEVLEVADHEPEPTFSPSRWPLVVTGIPATASAGAPFTVHVDEIRTPSGTFAEIGQGTPTPVAGATVEGAGVSAQPSDASGNLTVTMTQAGSVSLRAVKPGDAPSAAFNICAHSGNDGTCGTTSPSGSSTPAPGVAAAAYKGPYAVVAQATGVQEGHVYPRGRGPKVLTGTIATHASVASVSLKLRRSHRGRCFAYDGVAERFKRARCGAGSFFAVGSAPSFSYLLPAALAPGRYVLDIQASDAAGNRTTLARGTSRVVFYVR